jgi:ankyrin repeat protein
MKSTKNVASSLIRKSLRRPKDSVADVPEQELSRLLVSAGNCTDELNELLLVTNPDLSQADPTGLCRSVWHCAAGSLNSASLATIARHGDYRKHINDIDLHGRTALHYAILNDQICNESAADKTGDTPWKVKNTTQFDQHRQDHVLACIKSLLASGADINQACDDKCTPLHAAVGAKLPEVVELLCLNRSLTSTPDKLDRTPLHLAAWIGCTQSISILLRHGSDPNVKNGAQRTPIAVAAVYGHIDVIKLICQGQVKANIDDPADNGATPLHLVCCAST